MKNLSAILFCLFLTIWMSNGMAQRPAKSPLSDYESKEFKAKSGVKLPYRVLFPENYKSGKDYPIVLFLHGAGERGSDNTSQLKHGGAMFTNPVNREKYPCIVLFPQCPQDALWAEDSKMNQPTPTGKAVKELLDQYIKKEKVDKNRVYIMGLSMGGRGTFYMIENFPKVFAAAVPICGWVGESELKNCKGKVDVRIFHGDADDVVSVSGSRNAYNSLKGSNSTVEYIEYPAVNHGSWDYAFREKDFLGWIFSQSKK